LTRLEARTLYDLDRPTEFDEPRLQQGQRDQVARDDPSSEELAADKLCAELDMGALIYDAVPPIRAV